jgi:hypothetical protein
VAETGGAADDDCDISCEVKEVPAHNGCFLAASLGLVWHTNNTSINEIRCMSPGRRWREIQQL